MWRFELACAIVLISIALWVNSHLDRRRGA